MKYFIALLVIVAVIGCCAHADWVPQRRIVRRPAFIPVDNTDVPKDHVIVARSAQYGGSGSNSFSQSSAQSHSGAGGFGGNPYGGGFSGSQSSAQSGASSGSGGMMGYMG